MNEEEKNVSIRNGYYRGQMHMFDGWKEFFDNLKKNGHIKITEDEYKSMLKNLRDLAEVNCCRFYPKRPLTTYLHEQYYKIYCYLLGRQT